MRPQLHIEEITLMPHPIDAWRHALDLLITCAPGQPADVALHLRDAAMGMRRKPVVSEHASRLIQRLLILADVTLHASQPSRVSNQGRLDPFAATHASGKRLLTDHEAEIISQDLVAGVRQHRAEPQPSPSGCAATAALNGHCTSHQGQHTAHQCAAVAPQPSIEPAPQEQPASQQSPSRAAHVAQRFLAVDPDRS